MSKAERTDGFAGLLYLVWVHQINPHCSQSTLSCRSGVDRQLKQQLTGEILNFDSYTNLVLQYLRLEFLHDDLLLKQVQIEDLVKEIIRKYALFFIQKGLNVNLRDLDKEIVTDKVALLVVIAKIISYSQVLQGWWSGDLYMDDRELCLRDGNLDKKQ